MRSACTTGASCGRRGGWQAGRPHQARGKQAGGDEGVGLGREPQAEVGVAVGLLQQPLQLRQPPRREMRVLEAQPCAARRRRLHRCRRSISLSLA